MSDYVLNSEHPKGRDKARVFKAVLGIERRNAAAFAAVIRASLPRAVAIQRESDQHGQRWTTYHEVIAINGVPAVVTVAWAFTAEESAVPKLVSCYIETDKQKELVKLFVPSI